VYADAKDDVHSAYTFLIDSKGEQTAIIDDGERQSHIASLIRSDIE
jgi:cytochrome oxidase Cu insertion factor (SCO1/SenC/PrrC family)